MSRNLALGVRIEVTVHTRKETVIYRAQTVEELREWWKVNADRLEIMPWPLEPKGKARR